jgi:hypothetical protein
LWQSAPEGVSRRFSKDEAERRNIRDVSSSLSRMK